MKRNYFLLSILALLLSSCGDKDNGEIETPIEPVAARNAYDFVNSIGVNTHFGFYETNYWDKWDEITLPRLKELGVKHIRDGYGYRVPVGENRFIEAGKAGIKLLLSAAVDTPDELTPKLDALLPYLSGVEAVNEVDYTADPINRDPSVWVPFAKKKQKELFDLIKNTPKYSHLPVVALSLADIKNNASYLGDISEWIDYGNIHSYASGKHPANHWGYNQTWETIAQNAKTVFNTKKLMATEAGYHNYVAPGQSHIGVPESVSAIYIPHLFFEYFNKGIVRTYIYEFLDQHKRSDWPDAPELEWHLGLIRTDGTAKPAFTALKNIISLLSDNNENYTASPLAFELSAESSIVNADLRYTLLQKSDGKWWLAVYRKTEIFDPTFLIEKPIQTASITLKLGTSAKNINMFIPNKSTDKQETFQNSNSISFNLAAELVLFEISM